MCVNAFQLDNFYIYIFSVMPAYDLTTKHIIRLEVLWLFQHLIYLWVIRINFYWNSYDKDNLRKKCKIYLICSFYINLNL